MEKIICFDENSSPEKVIDKLTRLAKEGNYVFRGYEKQDQLLPSIIREKDLQNCENILLHDFEKYGSHYFHANTPIDFLSYAQHFGLPTRLLDFTYNPFIALAFATNSKKYSKNNTYIDDRTYYYIRVASINDNILLNALPNPDGTYISKYNQVDSMATRACQAINIISDMFGKNILNYKRELLISAMPPIEGINDELTLDKKIQQRRILFIDPNQSNQRIIMQQGLFMIPYTLDQEKHKAILEDNTSLIMIHENMRPQLRKYLDTLGFNSFRLMPDLASICEAVKRKTIDDRSDRSRNFKKKGDI